MKKILFVIGLVFLFFITEFFLFNIFAPWFKPYFFRPNLLLILIIFMNLWLGIRYGIFTAIVAGLICDSFSLSAFGINTISFVVCAYLAVILKKYIYQVGSGSSRMILICVVVFINIFFQYLLESMFININYFDVLRFILVPEIFSTLIVSTITFNFLKKCALKLFV